MDEGMIRPAAGVHMSRKLLEFAEVCQRPREEAPAATQEQIQEISAFRSLMEAFETAPTYSTLLAVRKASALPPTRESRDFIGSDYFAFWLERNRIAIKFVEAGHL